MASFLLIHGAWQSAACWEGVARDLELSGHRAVPATLTGLGLDRARLSEKVNLSTHIEDVGRAIDAEAEPVFLVGHSYAGMVVTGACERRPDRVRGIVYVDAFVPESGQSAFELLPEPIARAFETMAREQGGGWRLPAGEFLLDVWGTRDPSVRARVRDDFSDFSIHCFQEKLVLPFGHARSKPKGFIAGGANHEYPARGVFARFTEEARARGWLLAHIDAGHTCEVERPSEVARALASLSLR